MILNEKIIDYKVTYLFDNFSLGHFFIQGIC